MARERKGKRTAGGDGRFKKGNTVGKASWWKPGESGNPVGMPPEFKTVRDLARAYTGNAIRALVEIANNDSHPAQHQAAKTLLDRGHGAVDQELKITSPPDGFKVKNEVTVAQPDRIAGIAAILGRSGALAVAGAVGAAPPADESEADAVGAPPADGSPGSVPTP